MGMSARSWCQGPIFRSRCRQSPSARDCSRRHRDALLGIHDRCISSASSWPLAQPAYPTKALTSCPCSTSSTAAPRDRWVFKITLSAESSQRITPKVNSSVSTGPPKNTGTSASGENSSACRRSPTRVSKGRLRINPCAPSSAECAVKKSTALAKLGSCRDGSARIRLLSRLSCSGLSKFKLRKNRPTQTSAQAR